MTGARAVHVVVPEGIDDPTLPSGGNHYDRRLCEALGRAVSERRSLATVPDGAVVLVDGLVALSAVDEVLSSSARVVVLLHMAFGERDVALRADEQRVLAGAAAVVVTSHWLRGWVSDAYDLDSHVASPGADPAPLAEPDEAGGRLLCVAAVTPDKGHDVLLAALSEVADLPWTLTCVGSLSRDRETAVARQRLAADLGIADRVRWTDALDRDELDKAYASADLTVLASRAESWGMVVTESLANGIPVLAADVGGVDEAAGSAGWLVPVDDVPALSEAMRSWLTEPGVRADRRAAALARRTSLVGWSTTAERVARVLEEVGA